MAKQLNVSLAFTADTREAKAQLQDLQKQLNNILKMPSNKLGITDEIREAISATAELSSRLQQATNVNTGNLDFSKFNNSLKQSGQSLSAYGQQLQKLGPTGQQAFLTLTKSIATAEIPIKRTNALVKEFTTTLANAARWQISSSVLHGLMGSMQSAYRYAQDLNKSLTDIRIVAGQSADQMARFAQQANAAAKQLSATTLEYTNASLIYYQQGLTDQQVKERTDVTIKMANVSRQSAEIVSDQMTAVWNNFYNGSKSLEYYADVMTALGAATASSADEIAGGLEKFAAIGETIGLSYEYAASALATITSNTRQSEEVVGTALKTIFARIQGLNLGETLEDGVTLNKYSKALQSVGISIFDASGEMKKMDSILDEMGSKWETLNKAQQTALAQTVAGTRQYTQLVALMDNWDKGDSDSMQANLSTAYGSSGALQEQADIYAESWEAAQDRVTAAAEKIYNALLNDDFFIDILNGFEKVLTFVDQLIDNLGGLRGVLLALGAIVTKVFSAQISQGLTDMAYNIKMMTKSGRESVEKERRDFINNAVNSIPQNSEYTTDVEKAQQESLRTELTLQAEYMNNAERMSAIEAETNKKLIERTRLLREQTVELQKQKEKIDTRVSDGVMDLRTDISAFNMENRQTNQPLSYNEDIKPEIDNIKSAAAVQAELKDLNTVIELLAQKSEKGKAALIDIKTALRGLDTSADEDIARLVQEINQLGDSPDPEQLRQKLEALNLELEETIKISKQNIKDVVSPEAGKKVDALTQDLREQAQAMRDVRVANQEAKQSQEDTSNSIASATGAQKQWSDVMVESANVAFNVASAISMVGSAIDTLKDPDVSGMQKLVTVLSTMGMVLPTIISLIGTMKKLFSSETVAKIANAAATWMQVAAEKEHNKVKNEGSSTTRKSIKKTWEDTKNKWNEAAYNKRKENFETVRQIKGKDGKMTNVIKDKTTGKVMTEKYAKQTVGKEALKTLGSKAASLGIAAAGIAVIIGTIAMVVNQLNKAEKAVQKAKEAAQSLSENYDNVKASYDNFINAQSGYETATASMEELTKGTTAYQEALLQANEAAGELLATNKNLKYTIEDGKIVIDEESLEQTKADELKKVETAQAAKIAGQRELSEAEMELKKRDAARAMKSGSDGWQKAGNAAAGGILGAVGAGLAAGGIAGAVGGGGVFSLPAAAIGAVVGGVAGLVTGIVQETSTKTEQEAFDALAEKAETDEDFLARLKAGEVSEEEFKSIGIEDERLIASLQQNGEQVATLVGEMAANTAAINAQNDLVAANALGDNEAVQNSEYKDQIIDIAGDAYGHAYDKAMESDWVDSWGKDGIAQIDGANKEAKKVFDEYLKYAGLEGQGYTLTDTTGNDKNRKFVYEDAEGNEHEVSLEAMQAARAAYEASETLDNSATKLAETFDKLADSSNEADQALLSFVSGKNFEGATKGELEDIQEEVGTIEKNEDGTFTQDSLDNIQSYLEGALGETLTDDVAIRYGYESADAMIQAFATKLSDADEAWDNINVPSEFKFADDMSLGTAQALEKQIEKMNLGPLGEKAGEDYVNALNSMLGELDTEDQQKALSALTAIDWSDWDAMDQAEQIMKDLGVEIDTSSKEWQEFIENMRLANGAMPDFSQIKADLNQVCAILDKLDFGSVISEEDYARLVAYNDEWERFFMLQADGTRKFIGNAADMKQETRDSINEQRKELEYRKEIQEGMDNAGWNVNGEKVDWYKSGDQFSYAGSAQNLMNAGGDTEKVLGELGYTDDVIQEMIDDYNKAVESGDEEAIKKAEERFEAMYNGIGDFMGEDLDIVDAELDEMMASTATSFAELNQLFNEGLIGESKFGNADELTAYEKGVQSLAISGAQAAQSLSELESVWSQALSTGVELDYSIYSENLLRLAESYSICADEAREFEIALQSGNDTAIKAAEENLEASVMLGEAAQEYGFTQEELSVQAKQMAKAYGLNAKEAAQLAIQNQRMNKGVEDLVNNWEDWSKELKKGDKTSRDWAKAAAECTKTIANLVGASEDLELPEDFFDSEENMRLLEEVSKGSAEAINELGIVVARAQIQMMQFQEGMTNASGQPIDTSQFDAWKNTLMSGLTELQNSLDSLSIGDDVYNKLGGDDWVNALNEIAMATGMSVEQMQSMLNSMGVQAEVVTATKQIRTFVPEYTTQVIPEEWDGHGNITKSRSSTWQTGGEYMDGVMEVAQLNTGSGIGTPIKFTGNGNVSSSAKAGNSSGGGGGGSSKKTSDSRKKKSEIVDPYKEINDQLERTQHLMTKNSTLAEGLWGAARSAKMRENIALQKQYVSQLEEQLRISEEQMNLSRQDLTAAAGVLGLNLSIDSDGLVTNIVDVQEQLWRDREALLDSFGGEMDEDEQARLDAFDEYMENFTSAYDEYESHRQQQMQSEADILAAQLEAQQMMFDDLNQTLEENISLIEKDLELVEYYLSKVEDDFYGMAEAAALMIGSLSSANPGEGGQLGGYLDILAEQKRHKEELDAAYAAGEINQAQYIQGLMDCQSAIIEQLQNINELDKTMKGYYGETLEAAQEELSKYTDMMEHHSEVLEHYSSLLELIGASKDWERMKTVLEAQVSVAENAAAVSKANYEMLAQEAADKKAAWNALGKGLGDELTYEESVIKQQWLDAQAAADEAQNQMLDDAAAWAESLKSLLETELAELADILNESLSGEFGSLDNMMTAMERASSLQEEYLTTTNQVYETNKLMRTAQQEIDKTTNSVAKRRLKQYIDETEQLQNKNKLSQFELDIQKAKYDLLVAEIALEEAQQAKSTVRLQRDSEGNFGYVYTADQNAVAEAEQQLADAQNALYNIGLEGANKYAESYAQTIQEMNDAVTELTEQWQNGEIGSKEEYQQRMLELEQYYGEKLMQYSELHSIALQTDSRVASEAWTKDFAHMTTQTQKWMQNVDVYVQGVEASMDRYQQGIDRVEEYAGLDLDSLKTKTQNIKDENKALAKSITEKDGLLDAMKDEITEVGNLTREYAKLRTEIQGTVDDYEDLLRRMGVDIDTAAAGNPPFSGGETEDPDTTDPDTTVPETTDPGTSGEKTISVGGKVNASGAQIYDYAGDTSGEHQYFSSDPVYKVLKESGDWIQVRHHKLSSGITGWFKKSDVTAMNTGGYTGDWSGSYGKLAFLHQKELVLNAQDTENLLASMDILDKIISTIDLYSSSVQLGGMLSSPRYGGFDNEPLEQNVHIEASFPSVTDHNEIEDALNNLINKASQYANRK